MEGHKISEYRAYYLVNWPLFKTTCLLYYWGEAFIVHFGWLTCRCIEFPVCPNLSSG